MLETKPQTVLGFDFGQARIGVAVMNTLTGVPTPECVLQAKQGQPDWEGITQLIKVWRPSVLVVGMPMKLDGSASAMQTPILNFCKALAQRTALPVQTVCEQLSSREAEQRLKLARQAGRKRKIRKEDIDQVAATIILESWLMEQANEQ